MSKKTVPTVKQAETEENKDDEVKLKPFMGIRPGVYLTLLYSVVLLVILFFLLIFPGIINPHAKLLVKTEPDSAAVRIDGTYMGVSGSYINVPNGIHDIEAVLPGFESKSITYEISGRVFASLFFPARSKIELTLKTAMPDAVLTNAAYEFAEWSFAGEPTASWQAPLVLSENAYRIGNYPLREADEIIKAASRFAVTRAAARDLTRAKILLDNGGGSPSPAGLVNSFSGILGFLSENQGGAEWLAGLLPPESASILKNSNWYKNTYTQEIIFNQEQEAGNSFTFNGIDFIVIPNGFISSHGINNDTASVYREISGFMISENPVPRAILETFLNENPQWLEDYTDYLDEVLIFPSDTYEREIITGITWYAAQAFCEWLTGRLPSSMTGMEVKLPSELEWEYAASYFKSGYRGTTVISGMERSGWEWCADPFAPVQFITISESAVQAVSSPERVLRGRPSSSEEQTRASLPPEFSSPFVTFRLVIAEKAAQR